MNKVRTSAPGKLMLLGEHAVVYGYPCLVSAINQKIVVQAEPSQKTVLPAHCPFLETAWQNFSRRYGAFPVKIGVIKNFSSQYGLGSSAAVTVAAVKALFKLKNIRAGKKQLFDFCYQVVKQVQGLGSGFDVAASIYGGVLYYIKDAKIEKLPTRQLPLVVGYTGVKADTVRLVKQVAKLTQKQSIFIKIGQLVDEAKKYLMAQDWENLGKAMDQNQIFLKQLGVSNPQLDRLIQVARMAGAWGAKLSGAGGGDCMIALHPNGVSGKLKIEKAIEAAGGEVIRVKLSL